jgi:hypothetical protein
MGGLSFFGSICTINFNSIQGITNLPRFRTLMFQNMFYPTQTLAGGIYDGRFFVNSAGIGLQGIFSQSLLPVPPPMPAAGASTPMLTAAIDLITPKSPIIQFGKEAALNGAGGFGGVLTGTFYTKQLPTFIQQGVCTTLSL